MLTQTMGLFLNDEAQSYDGYTLVVPWTYTETYLIDNQGREVHSWPSDYRPANMAYMLPDGSLLRAESMGFNQTGPWTANGIGGRVELISWDGDVVWDWWFALPLALAGSVGSALTGYLIGRHVAFDWVQARLPQRLRKYEHWLAERGLVGVILFRVVTFTMPPALVMMGTLRIRPATMLLGTCIGFIPAVCAGVLVGGEIAPHLLDLLGVA